MAKPAQPNSQGVNPVFKRIRFGLRQLSLLLLLFLALSACQSALLKPGTEPISPPLVATTVTTKLTPASQALQTVTSEQTASATQTELTTQPDTTKDTLANPAYFMRLDYGKIHAKTEENAQYLINEHRAVLNNKAIDAAVAEQIERVKTQFKEENRDFRAEDKDYRAILNISTATFAIDNERFTYLIQAYSLNGGSAHGNSDSITLYFNLQQGQPLELGKILAGDYLSLLSKNADRFFRQSPTYKDQCEASLYREGIAPKAENFQSVVVSREGVELIFPRYQLFSGNFGEPSVSLAFGEQTGLQLLEHDATATSSSANTQATSSSQTTAVSESSETTAISTTATTSEMSPAPSVTVDPSAKLLALTFDDGPYTAVDDVIMQAAAQVDGHVTFFWLGNRLKSYPDTVKAVLAAGHEIGNHSSTHPQLTGLGSAQIQAELNGMDGVLEEISGQKPLLVRPTYGAYNDSVKSAAARPLITWSVDTRDWQSRDADSVYKAIMSGASDGAIILMHDLYPSTGAAVARAIPELATQGYKLVTVSELLRARGLAADAGQVFSACPPKD